MKTTSVESADRPRTPASALFKMLPIVLFDPFEPAVPNNGSARHDGPSGAQNRPHFGEVIVAGSTIGSHQKAMAFMSRLT